MSRKGLYLAVGFLWAMLFGIGAGLLATAVTAGVAWIYLFGDSPWPDWTNWAIPGVGAVIGLTTFAALMIVTRIVANRYDATGSEAAEEKGGGFAWVLLAIGLAVAGGVAWQEYGRQREFDNMRQETAEASRYFPILLSRTHRITSAAVGWPGRGWDGHAVVTLDGLREGSYRLGWQVRDTLYGKPVLKSEETLQLTAGSRVLEFALPAQQVVDGYRAQLSRHDADVMVDEAFAFEVELSPIPDDTEMARMPAHELHNLANGSSSLIDRSSVEFNVRFFLRRGSLSWD